MARIGFGLVLAVVGVLYLIVVWMALFSSGGFLNGSAWWAIVAFLVAAALAAGATVNLLREKRR